MNGTQPRPLIVAGILVVTVVIIGLLLVYLPLPEGIRSWLNIVFAPQEVKEHAYLGVENGKGVIYELGATGIKRHIFENYSVVEYVKGGDTDIAILKTDDGSHDVYDVSSDAPKRLTNDSRTKESLDVSPDGAQIVYGVKARSLPPPEGATEDDVIYNLPEWDVEHLSLETGEHSIVGPGNHPRFYKNGLLYPAPTGFVYRVIDADGFGANDTWSVLPDVMAYRVIRLAVLSEEGLMLFPGVSRSSYEAVIVDSLSPLKLKTAPEHPIVVPEGTRDMVLSGSGKKITVTYTADGRASILQIKENQPTSLFMFPSGYYPERFIREN